MKKILFLILLLFLIPTLCFSQDLKAKRVRIDDSGDYYAGTEVESALQEIGAGTTLADIFLKRNQSSPQTVIGTPEFPDLKLTDNILNTPSYSTLGDWLNNTQSSGFFCNDHITDGGSGMIDVTAGQGFIRAEESECGEAYFFEWPAVEGLELTNNDTNYIYVDYNEGTPTVKATIDPNIINTYTNFRLGYVYRKDLELHIVNAGTSLTNIPQKNYARLREIYGFQRASGMITSEVEERYLAITSGVLYEGLNRLITSAFNSFGDDRFTYWYRDGGTGWIEVDDQAQVSNTHWDNDSGTLEPLTKDYYAANWVYLDYEGHIHIVYPQFESKKQSEVEAQIPPTDVPPLVRDFCFLIARVIVQEAIANTISITYPFLTPFSASGIFNHNEAAGLQGGIADEYYHATLAEYSVLQDTSGVNTGDQDLSGLVPYSGATGDVDLGIYGLTTTGTGTFGILKATGDGTIWSDGTTGETPTFEEGQYFAWIPNKGALRVGSFVDSGMWADSQIGQYSTVFGLNNRGMGQSSFIAGEDCETWSDYSTAIGDRVAIRAIQGFGLGYSTQVNATAGTAIGNYARVGYEARNFTIVAGEKTITISGNVTNEYNIGDSLYIYPIFPVRKKANYKNESELGWFVDSEPVYSEGNTTFDITAEIDEITTGGQIVNNNPGQNSVSIGGVITIGTESTSIGKNFTNEIDNSIAFGLDGIDLLITEGEADFQDTDILTTGRITANEFEMPIGATEGYVLTSDADGVGTWQEPTGGGEPAGNDTEIQYNDNGVFGASPNFTYNSSLGFLNAGNTLFTLTGAGTTYGERLRFNGITNPLDVSAKESNIIRDISFASKLTGTMPDIYLPYLSNITSGYSSDVIFSQSQNTNTFLYGENSTVGWTGSLTNVKTGVGANNFYYVGKNISMDSLGSSITVSKNYNAYMIGEAFKIRTNAACALDTEGKTFTLYVIGGQFEADTSGTFPTFTGAGTFNCDYVGGRFLATSRVGTFDAIGGEFKTSYGENASGIRIKSPAAEPADTLIGVEVENMTKASNNYAIKTGAGSVYFGDSVAIKTGALPNYPLDVLGDINVGTGEYKIEGTSLVSDTAYGGGWDGDTTHTASKNAIYDAISGLAGGHDALTLDANADTILEITDQELGLDEQDANLIFAGPVSGAADIPTFRSLVADDIPDLSALYAPVLGEDDNYVTDAEKVVIGNTSGTNTGDQSTGLAVYGDGSDGDATIDTDTNLTSDMFYNDLTINEGVTLHTKQFSVFVKGTLTVNGKLSCEGNTGGNGGNGGSAGGTAGAAGAALTAGSVGAATGAGTAGIVGATRVTAGGTAGAQATAPTNQTVAIGGAGGAGGKGGSATAPSVAAGGVSRAGATVTPPTAVQGKFNSSPQALLMLKILTGLKGGAGGPGGSSGAVATGAATRVSSGGGGGGASGGGILVLAAKNIVNNGSISANGGDGGNAGESFTSGAGNEVATSSGGGAGGGGGVLALVYNSRTGAGTETADGGRGGSKGTLVKNGTGDGTDGDNGVNGSAGTIIRLVNQ